MDMLELALSSIDAGVAELGSVFYIIVFGSFLAALCNAAFSVGGAMIVLAMTSTVLPVTAIVPMHSALLVGSTTSRMLVFRQHIEWKIAGPFMLGSALAVAIASRIYVELPEELIASAIAALMLIAIWLPQIAWRPKLRHPWAIVGFVHSFFSTLFAYGALLHGIILHTSLNRRQIIGTMATCLTAMSVFKISGYHINGFDYTPYAAVIAFSVLAAFVGTWIGKLVVDRLSEEWFRFVFRWLVTVTALRLFYVALFA